MPFITLCGVTGRVYDPPRVGPRVKKHPCRDCFVCLGCSEDRCSLCRPQSVLWPDGDESASKKPQQPPRVRPSPPAAPQRPPTSD